MRLRRIFAILFVVVAACYASSRLFPSNPLPGSTSPDASIDSWKQVAFDPVLIAAAIYSASRPIVVTSGFTFVAFTSHVVTTNVRAEPPKAKEPHEDHDTHTIVLYALAGVGAVGTLVCSAIFLFVLCARPF